MHNRGAMLSVVALVAILLAVLLFKGCSSPPVEEPVAGGGYTTG